MNKWGVTLLWNVISWQFCKRTRPWGGRRKGCNCRLVQNWGSEENRFHLAWLAWSISLGNIGKERREFKSNSQNRELDREHPLGLNTLEANYILCTHFHLPFKIPGTSFHPLLPIGICSPLIICHLEKLCLNSLCIWPLLSVYLWCFKYGAWY